MLTSTPPPPPPPPMPEIEVALVYVPDVHAAVMRMNTAWNKTQLLDAINSAEWFLGTMKGLIK